MGEPGRKSTAEWDRILSPVESRSCDRTSLTSPASVALLVHTTGIVDYSAVCRANAERIETRGGDIRRGIEATAIAEEDGGVRIASASGRIEARKLIACAGLQSDRIALMPGSALTTASFRSGANITCCRRRRPRDPAPHLPHSRPEPSFPGNSPDPDDRGGMTVGPNAVLGFAREGYPKGSFQSGRCSEHGGVSRLLENGGGRIGVQRSRNFANSASRFRYLRECRNTAPRSR